MAVKGEKGSPVSAVNHWRCADMFSFTDELCVHVEVYFAFTNCIFIIRVLQDLQGLRALEGQQDHRAAKETR